MRWICSSLLSLLSVAVLASAQTPIDIGSRLELFVDEYLVDAHHGTVLQLQAPVPAETVLKFDSPWDGIFSGYTTMILDGGKYRLYYRGFPVDAKDGSDMECTCYAESTDGIHFTKPSLGFFDFQGSKDNNIILSGAAPLSHNFAPSLDTNPAAKPEERYKALTGIDNTGLFAYVSPDGIRWKKLREEPVLNKPSLTKYAFDSQNIAFWSESESCYVCYFRVYIENIRTISRTTSKDFVNWTEPVVMSFGDAPREHLYTNQTVPYFRAPNLYIATAARFMPGRRVVTSAEATQFKMSDRITGDCSDTVLLTSRGGTRYDRTFMEGFVRPGIGASNWTTRTNYPTRGIVPINDSEMAMYVQRDYGQPTHHLQRLKLRTDGFASLHAAYKGGDCVTKPLTFSGKELVINYSTSAAGSVWVALQDTDGKPIAGFGREDADEIIGDEIARVVTWKGKSDVSALAGKAVRLAFYLKDSDVFSFQFKK